MSGPGFTLTDVIGIAVFAANYFIVAPVSLVCVGVGVVRREHGPQRWLVPIAIVNVAVALAQLVLSGTDSEAWLSALLVLQIAVGIAVVAWVRRAMPART